MLLQRRQSQVIIIVLLVLIATLVWGCDGAGGDTEVTIAPVTTLQPGPSTDALSTSTTNFLGTTMPVTASPGPGASGNGARSDLVGTQARTTAATPQEYVTAVGSGRPVVVLFFVAAGSDDQRVLQSISTLQSQFPDYTFLIYDVADPAAYGDLPTLLEIDYPPALVLIDDSGRVDTMWDGYIDLGTLTQTLTNLGVRS